ncbi:MAG: winged helix-turn-helix transcriptional regulator [Nitrospirae bacterium]|nr:winged helix-turn-helix transcriptional regulator [Nitrospirota bacterium]
MNNMETLRLIFNPVRLAILDRLAEGVKCVSDLEVYLELSQSNVSQHLSILRHAGIIDCFTDGRQRCYFLKSPLIPDLLEILHKDYGHELPVPACCPVSTKGTCRKEKERQT